MHHWKLYDERAHMNGSSNNDIRDSQKFAQIMGQFQLFKWGFGMFVLFILAIFGWIVSDVNRNEQTIYETSQQISRVETDVSWIKHLLRPGQSSQLGNY